MVCKGLVNEAERPTGQFCDMKSETMSFSKTRVFMITQYVVVY